MDRSSSHTHFPKPVTPVLELQLWYHQARLAILRAPSPTPAQLQAVCSVHRGLSHMSSWLPLLLVANGWSSQIILSNGWVAACSPQASAVTPEPAARLSTGVAVGRACHSFSEAITAKSAPAFSALHAKSGVSAPYGNA